MTPEPRAVRVAVAGVGYWGPNIVRTLSSLAGVEVAAIVDRDPARLAFIVERYPGLVPCTEIDPVLADGSIDAVVVATPIATHADLALRVIEAGKDVLVEKPLALNDLDAARIMRAADAAGRVLMTGEVFLYAPASKRLIELVSAGEIGEVLYVDSVRMNPGPASATMGVVWDLAPHDLSIGLRLLAAPLVRVAARATRRGHHGEPVMATVTAEAADGATLQVHVGWLAPYRVRRAQVFGRAGAAVYDDIAKPPLLIYPPAEDSRVTGTTAQALFYQAGEPRAVDLEVYEPLAAELGHFVDCVRTRATPHSDGRSGARIVQALAAAERSIANDGAWEALALLGLD